MKSEDVLAGVRELAARFAEDRPERQLRRHLDPADFAALRDAGFLLTGVDQSQGGLWHDVARSTRPVAEILRTLARGDPSVALVSSMHPAVLSFWLARPEAPAPFTEAWAAQRAWANETARDGAWWGTITSEPGSGGDVAKSRAQAAPTEDGRYKLTGQKHFGSGSGIASYMLTSAVPQDEPDADWWYLDVRDVPWDGSAGMRLLAEWDGHGMAATQSHAFEFTSFPAERFAWPGQLRAASLASGALVSCCFTAVIVGVVDAAIAAAGEQLVPKRPTLRAYELTEWTAAQNEAWLVRQAFEGMLRSVEARGAAALLDASRGKAAIAGLAESLLGRICRVVGGATFSRRSPFGFWFEDVRALGFLRPPWGLAFDTILELSLADAQQPK